MKQKFLLLFGLLLALTSCQSTDHLLDEPDNASTIYSINASEFNEKVAGRLWVCTASKVVDENDVEQFDFVITGYDILSTPAFSCEGSEFTRCYWHFSGSNYTEPRARFIYDFDFDEVSGFVSLTYSGLKRPHKFRIESVSDDSLIMSKHHDWGYFSCYDYESREFIEVDNEKAYVRMYFRPAIAEEVEKFSSWPLCPTEN